MTRFLIQTPNGLLNNLMYTACVLDQLLNQVNPVYPQCNILKDIGFSYINFLWGVFELENFVLC